MSHMTEIHALLDKPHDLTHKLSAEAAEVAKIKPQYDAADILHFIKLGALLTLGYVNAENRANMEFIERSG